MGEHDGTSADHLSVRNDLSGTVYGPVGQFGTVHGDVHFHGVASATDHDDMDDEDSYDTYGDGGTRLRNAAICGALAVATAISFGIATGQWKAIAILSAIGAICLYRVITPSNHDGYAADSSDDEAEVVHEHWEETWEYAESETWEER